MTFLASVLFSSSIRRNIQRKEVFWLWVKLIFSGFSLFLSSAVLFIHLSIFMAQCFIAHLVYVGEFQIRNKAIYIDISSKSYRNVMKLWHVFLSSPLLPSPNNSNFWQLFGPIVSPMHEEFWVLAKAMIRYNLVFYFSLPAELFLQQTEYNFLSYHEPKPW